VGFSFLLHLPGEEEKMPYASRGARGCALPREDSC
jgi:hypothetical protein